VFSGLLAGSDDIFNEHGITAGHDRMKIFLFTIVVIVELLPRYILYCVLFRTFKVTRTNPHFLSLS
jgi:hypothetical protein